MTHLSRNQLFILVAALGLIVLSVRFVPYTTIIVYSAALISSSILYWIIARHSLSADGTTKELVTVLAILFIARIGFLGMPPVGSDDIGRYMWDGRVQAAGVNPYRYAPNDSALQFLHTDQLPAEVNHPEMKTIYFPLSQWLFFLAYTLSGENVWGFQILTLIAEALTFWALLLLTKELSLSPWHTLLYAANPLVILQFSLDAHVDALGFPLMLFALLFYQRNKLAPAMVLIGCSLLIKPVGFVILPVFFLDQSSWVRRAGVVFLPLLVLLLPFVPYSFGVNPFEALTTFSKHWFFNGALFSILFPFLSDNQVTRMWCFAVLLVLLCIVYFSKRTFFEKTVLAVLLLLLCSPVVHLWYVGWLIVLLPLVPLSGGIALAATASLPSVTFVTYQITGLWKDYPLVLVLEYVPVIVLAAWVDFHLRGKFQRSRSV